MLPTRRIESWLPSIPSIFSDFFGNEWLETVNARVPAINIIENENEFLVEVAAPGLTKDDFKIKIVDDDQLQISFEKKEESEERDKKGNYLRREFSYTNFLRTLLLPDNVDKEKISAKAENGVLHISIPKTKESKQVKKEKEIEIK
ncbi:MAG: Hsp20/alpha crystallin family protein [Dysgonamonadaceae bacterium]|jgi:HSP20 family protein|nr:Hsp20/alpha crystallin family protein [Dysgonamonadaceae bacterium]MDD3494706.1 Hsp20/alpha crystallin family protein [Dysgonamonadaceae bacterium]MDD4378427.1 Hsp20/alpha crystallin family protein [Dysgonamonadaceae bacterium]